MPVSKFVFNTVHILMTTSAYVHYQATAVFAADAVARMSGTVALLPSLPDLVSYNLFSTCLAHCLIQCRVRKVAEMDKVCVKVQIPKHCINWPKVDSTFYHFGVGKTKSNLSCTAWLPRDSYHDKQIACDTICVGPGQNRSDVASYSYEITGIKGV